jgi:hypothetical protein
VVRLSRGLLPGAVILGFVIGGCGPTANVTTTPTPSAMATPQLTASESPTTSQVPTSTPAQGSPTPAGSVSPLPTGTTTGNPLATETPPAPPTPVAGAVWRQVEGFPSGLAIEVRSVVATASGFVAVGYEPMPGEGAFGRHQGLVWRSVDGLSWDVTPDPAFQLVIPEKIVVLGESLFVLGKLSNCPDIIDDECVDVPEAGWAIWRSTNGAAWERLPQLPSMQAGIVDDLVAGNDRLAAFGAVGEDDSISTVWFSTDGATWIETADLAGLDPISAMAAAPTGFSAFGTQFMPDLEESEVRAALTTDYSHLVAAAAPAYHDGITIEDVTSGSGGMVAVGYGTPDSGLVSVALYSSDGAAWTEATSAKGSLAGGGMTDVHALTDGRYVALGYAPETDEFGRLQGQSWFSPDGQSWRALEPMGGLFDQLETSALGATGLVVFTVVQDELDEENVTSTISLWFAPADQLAAL